MGAAFRALGDLEVRTDNRPVDLGSPRQRCVLVVLILDVNQVVSIDQIVERVWGDLPRTDVRGSIYSYVSRLRRVLAPASEVCIDRRSGGYVLRTDRELVDVHLFRDLVQKAARTADPERTLALYEQALDLWRGEPFARLDSSWLDVVRDNLAGERLAVQLERFDLQLARGGGAQVLDELTNLVHQHPLVERLSGQLMRALHSVGRRTEALRRFQRLRSTLAEELGVGPDTETQHIHQAILRDERDLAAAVKVSRASGLPRAVPDFAGRTAEIERLVSVAGQAAQGRSVVIAAINGMAGIGKTALVLHVAHRLSGRFPDGQVFINLHGHTPNVAPINPAAALDDLLRQLGVAAQEIPDGLDARAARWRAAIAGRRLIVVVDDAASTDQIRPLLPGSPGALVLVTSRRRLAGLDAARTLSLDTLVPADAHRLFALIAGDSAAAEPEQAGEVVRLCGRLPLAIRIAAARLAHRPSWTVHDLANRLRDEQHRLTELTVDDRSVRSAFALSYRELLPEQRAAFRLLGLHPGTELDVPAAAALLGHPARRTADLLEALLDANLLTQPTSGRYRFHDLVRYFAQTKAQTDETADTRTAATARLRDYYLAAAAAAMRVFEPSERRVDPRIAHPPTVAPSFESAADAERWLALERPNLVRVALSADTEHSWVLPHLIRDFFHRQAHYTDWLDTHLHALAVAETTDDEYAEAITSIGIGFAYYRVGRLTDAEASYERAISLSAIIDSCQLGTAINNLGRVRWFLGRRVEALTLYRRALALFVVAGHRGSEAYALYNFCHAAARLGHNDIALAHLPHALELTQQVERRYGEAVVLGELGNAHLAAGNHDLAKEYLTQSLTLSRDIQFLWAEATAQCGLGLLYLTLSRPSEAIAAYTEGLRLTEITQEFGVQCSILNSLGTLHAGTDDCDTARTYFRRAHELARRIGITAEANQALTGLSTLDSPRGAGATARTPP